MNTNVNTKRATWIMVLLVLSAATSWGLTPQNMARIERRVAEQFPEARVLEVERESDWANNIISVLLSNGRELYLDLDDRVLEIEREPLDSEERQIARTLANEPGFPALTRVYGRVLQQLAESEEGSRVTPEYFYRIEYEQERGQLVVEIEFRSGTAGSRDPERRPAQVTVYANPRSGDIIAVRRR